MLFQRRLHRRVLALQRGVIAAHQPLQLGKLAHRLGGQIRLGEHGRALHQCLELVRRHCRAAERRAFGIHRRGDLLRQRRDAADAFALGAEPGVEGHAQRVELGHALVERFREIEPELFGRGSQRVAARQVGLVGLPEIQRVGEARADDLAVAAGDLGAAVAGSDVGDQHELVRQRAVAALPAGDEALLVDLDGQLDDLGRDLQEGFLELAHQRHRPFDQAGDLFQQRLVGHHFQPAGKGQVLGVVADHVLAPLGVENHEGLFQPGDIVVEAAHAELVGRMEAMAARDIAGPDAVDLEIDDDRLLGLGPEGA